MYRYTLLNISHSLTHGEGDEEGGRQGRLSMRGEAVDEYGMIEMNIPVNVPIFPPLIVEFHVS